MLFRSDFFIVSTYSTGSEPNRRVVVAYGRPRRSERKQGGRAEQE